MQIQQFSKEFFMQNIQKLVRYFIPLLLSVALISGCASGADLQPDNQTQHQINKENSHANFTQFTDELFLREITSDSITFHYTLASPQALSLTAPEPDFGTCGEAARVASIKKSQQYLEKLNTLYDDSLPKEDKITYDIMKWQLETICSFEKYPYFSEPFSPTGGIQAQLPILLAEYEFRTPYDIEDYLLLLKELPEYFNAQLTYEQEKAKQGLFMAEACLDTIITQCKDFQCPVKDHYLTATFQEKIDKLSWIDKKQKEEFKKIHKTILQETVYPAYENLAGKLDALRSSSNNQEGLCHYTDGKKYYTQLVRSSTGSESSPSALIARTASQMQSDLEQMALIMEKNPAVLEKLGAPTISLSEPEEILNHLKKAITNDFPTPPNVSCSVKYVNSALEEHTSPAFYLIPPIDRISQNVIYINQSAMGDNIQLFTTLAHEGYPGHLYQNVYSQEFTTNKARALFSFPGYAEGYATYAEMHSYNYMDLDKDVSRLLQLSSSVTLGLYAALDLNIHYEGWSIKQAAAFLKDYGITDEDTVRQIYNAIVGDPANYLKYYIGYLEFLTLKGQAKEAWGDDYSHKKYHEYILQMGEAPFCVLEKYLT